MNYGGYIVRLYLRQSSRIGRDAKTIGASYVVLVHAFKKRAPQKILMGSFIFLKGENK